MVTVNREYINENSGLHFRLSGSLFMCRFDGDCVGRITFSDNTRDGIKSFSKSSSARMRRYLRESTADYRYMLTLTYPFEYPSNGADSKEHLRRFLQEVRRYHERSGAVDMSFYSSFWFLEFQGRGAPHYHIFTTDKLPMDWVARRWYEIVASDDDRHLRAGTRIEEIRAGKSGIISYAAKYANKNEQKAVPKDYENVGRFWGVSGFKNVVAADTKINQVNMQDAVILKLKNRLLELVNKAILEKNAKELKKEKGKVWIVVFTDDRYRNRIQYLIRSMESLANDAKNMRCSYESWMFRDAEVD